MIRRLTDADADAFYAMRLRSADKQEQYFRSSVADIERDGLAGTRKLLQSNDVRAVGAFDNAAMVGIGAITKDSRDKLNHKALLWGMYVSSEAAGNGIGSAIVHALINEAAGFVRSLHLTLVANNERAKVLYERCGFAIYGREPNSVRHGDIYLDELLMWLPLK